MKTLIASIILATSLFAIPVYAEPSPKICEDSRQKIVDHLMKKYGEVPFWKGDSDGIIRELFVNPDPDKLSWSFISTNPGKGTCLNANGYGWSSTDVIKGLKL